MKCILVIFIIENIIEENLYFFNKYGVICGLGILGYEIAIDVSLK